MNAGLVCHHDLDELIARILYVRHYFLHPGQISYEARSNTFFVAWQCKHGQRLPVLHASHGSKSQVQQGEEFENYSLRGRKSEKGTITKVRNLERTVVNTDYTIIACI